MESVGARSGTEKLRGLGRREDEILGRSHRAPRIFLELRTVFTDFPVSDLAPAVPVLKIQNHNGRGEIKAGNEISTSDSTL